MDGVNIISQTDLTDAVRSTALLADLTISMWGAERTDRKLMDEIKTAHNAVGNVGKTIKNLLAGCDGSLKATRSAFAAARTAHYTLTLPWVTNAQAERQTGARLLPNLLFERYLQEMSRLKRAAEAQLDAFVAEYPALVIQAQANLASMANALDYPTPDQVRAAFRLAFDFEPIPAANAFQGLPSSFIEKLGAGLRRRQEAAVAASQAALWERVRETVTYMADRLADTDTKFRAATIENVRELLGLLPGFNVAGDERVDATIDAIKQMLAGVDATTIRGDAQMRQDVVNQARRIADKLSAWGV